MRPLPPWRGCLVFAAWAAALAAAALAAAGTVMTARRDITRAGSPDDHAQLVTGAVSACSTSCRVSASARMKPRYRPPSGSGSTCWLAGMVMGSAR
jgi:hypothetical protein